MIPTPSSRLWIGSAARPEEVAHFYQIFVVDHDRRLVGTLPFKDLVISRPDRVIGTFMADADISVLGTTRRKSHGDGPIQPSQRRGGR